MPGITTMVGWVFTKLTGLPADGEEGQLEYMADRLWLRDSVGWKSAGGSYQYSSNTASWPRIYSVRGTSDSSGVVTLTLPTGYFTTVHAVIGQVVNPSMTPSNAAFVVVNNFSPTSFTGTVFQARGTLLLSASAVQTAANITVDFVAFGA